MTFKLTTRNSLKLWNWHIRNDLQNHFVKACNSNFRRNLQQQPDEFENPTDVWPCPRISGSKQNLEQSIIETASSYIHSLIDNFEACFPKQQGTELKSKLWMSSLFSEQHPPRVFGHKSKKRPMPTSFYQQWKTGKRWILGKSRRWPSQRPGNPNARSSCAKSN